MPRDDLSINSHFREKMPQIEHQDAATVLDEWTNRVANFPAEIAFMQEEIAEKDREMQQCLQIINSRDAQIQKWIRINGSHISYPKEDGYRKEIRAAYDRADLLQEEKLALALKTQQAMDKHTRNLDQQIKALQDRGEFPNDPDIPSLLRPQPEPVRARIESSVASMPLGQIQNGASMVHARHPNQHPQRMIPAQIQAQQIASATTSSAPATPAASLLLSRQARESSLGAAANKRQRVTGGLGTLPSASSNLARHSSMTPGTPRAGTPSGGRAGSAGPRTAQKTTKKVAPLGSRQSGLARKGKPGKSGLSRVKRTGNKNSPSSTNDSELSDAETGSVDDEDGDGRSRKDVDGDEDMLEDPEDADDKKYCTCERVSFGDMVACDNDSCPYEWFHWECVGITREPPGVWICETCTKAAAKEQEKDGKKLK